MNTPNWFKIVWWILLLIISSILIAYRLNDLISGTTNTVDTILLAVFIVLVLLPLFQEFDIFGVKLKSQIKELKSDIKEQIVNLRTEVNPQIYLTPPPDSQLGDIENKFREILDNKFEEQKIAKPVDIQTELVIPHDINYLFIIRHNIEKELRRIWKERFQRFKEEKYMPIHRITQFLKEEELIEPRLANIIREIYSICSPAIHGEPVTKRQVDFVRDLGPKLITTLMSIK
jgi:hypothetical protein